MSGVNTVVRSLTLAIISSQHLVGLGLQKIFESRETVRIVVLQPGMTSTVLLAERRPDVFILDLDTEQDAIGTMRQIKESAPKSKIVLLSGFEDTARTREAFECGVDGVILKIQPAAVVLAVIEALYSPAHNPAPVKPHHDVVGMDLNAIARQAADPNAQSSVWLDGLTERKREIIRLVGQGLSNKDIADRLCISDSTVRHHLTGIFDKIGVSNRQRLLIHAHHFRSVAV